IIDSRFLALWRTEAMPTCTTAWQKYCRPAGLSALILVLAGAGAILGQEPATLKGHTGWIALVAFAPDGQALATASGDKTVKLWQLATGRERATLHGHTDYVSAVAFAPDGQLLATGSYDHTAKLWDVATGRERQTLRGHRGVVLAVAFSPDGRTLATGS